MALPPVPVAATTTTFDTLVADLRPYVERGGLNDEAVNVEIPRAINRGERDLADQFEILGYIGAYTSKMKINEPRIAKPENWRKTVSMNFGTGNDGERRNTLRLRSYEYIRAVCPSNTAMGEPQYVADYDYKHWLVLPIPNLDFPFEAMIWQLPPLLCEANPTNFLTDMQPNLLLYKSLSALESFLKNDARAAYWKGLADERFASVSGEDRKRMVDRAAIRKAA